MKSWLRNLGIALSQLANVMAMGDPDETLSSRVGKRHPWAARIVDAMLGLGHSASSIEADEGARGLPTASRQAVAVAIGFLLLGMLILFVLTR